MNNSFFLSLFYGWAASVLAVVSSMAVKQKSCPDDQYWDFGTDRCETCGSICVNADQTGFGDFCREMCPAYANAVPGLAGDKSTPPVMGHQEDGLSLGSKAGIAVGACAVVLTVVLVVAVVLYKRRPPDPIPIPVHDDGGLQGRQETPAGFRGTYSFAPTQTDMASLRTLLDGHQREDGEMTGTRI